MLDIAWWFIPIDILKIVCALIAIILALIFLLIIIYDRTCHTVPMMLVANTCFIQFLYAIDALIISSISLHHDLKQIDSSDFFCIFGGTVSYMVTMIQMYSYLLQAIYRYILIVYPSCFIWQSVRLQILLISMTWMGGIIYVILLFITGQIIYLVDDQICQMPLRLSPLTIFNAAYIYIFPLGVIMFVYFKMILYVREMSKRITPVNILSRAQRELRMIHRIVSLVLFLLLLGLPYVIFILMSFFNSAPRYHFRIAYIFIIISLALMMIALFEIAEPLKTFVTRKIKRRPTAVVPTLA